MKYQCKAKNYTVFAEFENSNKGYSAFYGVGSYSTGEEAKEMVNTLLNGECITKALVFSPDRSVVYSSYPIDKMGHYETGAWVWDVNILDINSYVVKK